MNNKKSTEEATSPNFKNYRSYLSWFADYLGEMRNLEQKKLNYMLFAFVAGLVVSVCCATAFYSTESKCGFFRIVKLLLSSKGLPSVFLSTMTMLYLWIKHSQIQKLKKDYVEGTKNAIQKHGSFGDDLVNNVNDIVKKELEKEINYMQK